MATITQGVYRAESIGSLLRPRYLQDAKRDREAGAMPVPAFKQIEDRAVDEAIQLQESVGLDVITDGEMRRRFFAGTLTEAVSGIAPVERKWSMTWHGEVDELEVSVAAAVVDKLERKSFLALEEFVYARAKTDKPVKATLPSPFMLLWFWDPDRSRAAYSDVLAMIKDGADIVRQEIQMLVDLGCTYIQIDAPDLSMLIDEPTTARFSSHVGVDAIEVVGHAPEILDDMLRGFADLYLGLHVCRGNNAGRWANSGGYQPLIPIFRKLDEVDVFLLEYDSDRAGALDAIAGIPDDKVVVLGLLSTKTDRVEEASDIRARIEEAAQSFPLEQLALSTQCGFASVDVGNPVAAETQRQKLSLVSKIAHDVWG